MSSQKNKIYLEHTADSIRALRVTGAGSSIILEDAKDFVLEGNRDPKAELADFARLKRSNFARAVCGVYPKNRILGHHTLGDMPKAIDKRTLDGVLNSYAARDRQQIRWAVLNAGDGLPVINGRLYKNLLICGAPHSEIQQLQNQLVAWGIYPERLEIPTLASLGLLTGWLRNEEITDPVLVLELSCHNSQSFILKNGQVDSARPIPLGFNSMISGVREDLGLKDDDSARRLFFSDSFDFTEMGPRLIERILRELQSMIGLYEVRTGQSIGHVACIRTPTKLSWLTQTFARSLGMRAWEPDFQLQIKAMGLRLNEGVYPEGLDFSHVGLLGLIHGENSSR